MDKTKVVSHEDEDCKKKCVGIRKSNMPKTAKEIENLEKNLEIGRKLRKKMDEQERRKKEMTDREYIDELIIKNEK